MVHLIGSIEINKRKTLLGFVQSEKKNFLEELEPELALKEKYKK